MFFTTLLALHNINEIRLEDMNLKSMAQDWATAQRNRSVDKNPLMLGGKTFDHGVGTHATSDYTIRLDKKAVSFHAVVGVDDETQGRGSVRFIVTADTKVVFDSGNMRGKDRPKVIDLNLKGVSMLSLEVEDAGDGIDYDHADWADAVIQYEGNAPQAVVSNSIQPDPIIAPIDRVQTRINGAKAIGTTPGKEFVFRVPVTGKAPIQVSVSNLPAGLIFDAKRQIIVGRVRSAGITNVKISATGPGGSSTQNLKIVAGRDKLSQTPPMGWNSWNVWGLDVDTDKVRAAADQFVKLGLADVGYTFVNIDDGWEKDRAANGEIVTNSKFRNMKGLTDYIHGLGLKMGIYSSPGPKTCGGYEGSYQHEEQDAASYAKWGVDYLKYDWCSYGSIEPRPDLDGMKYPYIKMQRALEASDRDIVFSLCQYGMGDVYKWGRSIGGNVWRTTGDINDSWSSMSSIGFDHSKRSPYAGPGGWNDPDMLVVGWLGWSTNIRPTKLTKHEQVTHITLWSMLAAPLLLGCDLTRIDDWTLRLIANPEVLAIDQDPLGKAAVKTWSEGKVEAWARPLEDGSYAVSLFNRGKAPVTKNFDWKVFGVKGDRHFTRDLWQRKDMGRLTGLKVTVPAHGALLYKVR